MRVKIRKLSIFRLLLLLIKNHEVWRVLSPGDRRERVSGIVAYVTERRFPGIRKTNNRQGNPERQGKFNAVLNEHPKLSRKLHYDIQGNLYLFLSLFICGPSPYGFD